jgi:hypothetical protein
MQQGLAAGERRSSVVLITFGVTEHKRGCYERLARQVRQSGKAFLLALLCVPLALALEPVAVLSRQVPAEDFPQASCEDLSMDRRGVGYQATAGFSTWMAEMSLAIMMIATVPRTPRVQPHLLVGTLATCAYLLLYMRTVFTSPREAFWLSGPSVVFVVSFAAPFSFFVWYLATARPGCKLAALLLVACVLLPMLITILSIITVLYIVLSEQVSGFAGLLINGVAYPLALVSNRKTLLELLRAVATGDSINFAGISVLGLEIISSTPQFYVLTRYVFVGPAEQRVASRGERR